MGHWAPVNLLLPRKTSMIISLMAIVNIFCDNNVPETAVSASLHSLIWPMRQSILSSFFFLCLRKVRQREVQKIPQSLSSGSLAPEPAQNSPQSN